jgi:polyhydroxybutyrate depolymerase
MDSMDRRAATRHARTLMQTAVLSSVLVVAGCGGNPPLATPLLSAPTALPAPSPVPTLTTSTTPTPAPAPSVTTAQIEVGGVTRDYIVATPPDVADRDQLPLLLVLHGAGMTMAGAEALTGFDAMSLDPGAVIVYPQGEKDPDEPGLGQGGIWNSGQTDTGFDDVAFLTALMDRMEADYPIDPARVFIVGGSNGGQMAYRVACDRADRIAAVADLVGALLVDCQPSQPVSVIDIHGTADDMIPIEGGGQGCLPMACPPLADTMLRWRDLDGCRDDATVTTEGRVETTSFSTCADGTAVTFITVDGGTHYWYSSNPDDRAVTWDFFMNHPRSAVS